MWVGLLFFLFGDVVFLCFLGFEVHFRSFMDFQGLLKIAFVQISVLLSLQKTHSQQPPQEGLGSKALSSHWKVFQSWCPPPPESSHPLRTHDFE